MLYGLTDRKAAAEHTSRKEKPHGNQSFALFPCCGKGREYYQGGGISEHYPQPTLSRQLALLEEETGVTLFKRGSHRITLTYEGVLLRRRAEEIVSLADRTMDELNAKDRNLSGTVSIGTGGLAAKSPRQSFSGSFMYRPPCMSEPHCSD